MKFQDQPDDEADYYGPWFRMVSHRLTPQEIAELKENAQESGQTVHQWIDGLLRTAVKKAQIGQGRQTGLEF